MIELEKLQQENTELKQRLEKFEREKPIFASRLKKVRSEKGYTQQQLADKLGIARITLTQYERAVNEPKLSMIVKISTLLNVSLDWLCGRTEKMTT